mmetsp:Transcript_12185/g.22823  ORF Transcript_12185/g.22823 Transcript_12185/m.22823 type:complete len:100 (+) Transcript_12185:3112-3411(+)
MMACTPKPSEYRHSGAGSDKDGDLSERSLLRRRSRPLSAVHVHGIGSWCAKGPLTGLVPAGLAIVYANHCVGKEPLHFASHQYIADTSSAAKFTGYALP